FPDLAAVRRSYRAARQITMRAAHVPSRSEPIKLATSNLLERPLVLAHELANFPRDFSYSSLSLSLIRLSGAIGQLVFHGAIWWFEPAQSQLRCQIIHPSFFRAMFVSKPAPNCNDPVFVQPPNISLAKRRPRAK